MKYVRILILLVLFPIVISSGMADIKWSAGFGLRTFTIMGTTPNSAPMVQRDSTLQQYIGGGYRHPNSAIAIMGYATFGASDDFVIPFGVEYYEMISRERIPVSKNTTAYLRNTIIVPSALIGFNYKFYKFPFADVKAFIGIEFDANFNQSPEFYRRIEYSDSIQITNNKPKKPATRVGADIKLGFDGNIYGPLSINANIAFGFQNILFRDNNRGELYTPTRIEETTESLVSVLKIGLILRYRF